MSEKKSFKDTLNLPTTEFSIRANAKAKDKRTQEALMYLYSLPSKKASTRDITNHVKMKSISRIIIGV